MEPRVKDLGFGNLGFRIQDSGSGVHRLRSRVFSVWELESRVKALGFGV